MAVLEPAAFFDHADHLVARGREVPTRQVDIRRAISAAYYGVFHFVCASAADHFVGAALQSYPRYVHVYRSVDHRDVTAACHRIGARPDVKSPLTAAPDGFPTQLKQFANATTDLQRRRHVADYDPGKVLRVADAEVAVALARGALALFAATPEQAQLVFLTLLLFKQR